MAAHGAIGVGAGSVGCDCNRPGTLAIVLEQGIVEAAGGIPQRRLVDAERRRAGGYRAGGRRRRTVRRRGRSLEGHRRLVHRGRTGYIGREVEKCVTLRVWSALGRSAEQAAHGLGGHDGVSAVIAAVLQSGLRRGVRLRPWCGCMICPGSQLIRSYEIRTRMGWVRFAHFVFHRSRLALRFKLGGNGHGSAPPRTRPRGEILPRPLAWVPRPMRTRKPRGVPPARPAREASTPPIAASEVVASASPYGPTARLVPEARSPRRWRRCAKRNLRREDGNRRGRGARDAHGDAGRETPSSRQRGDPSGDGADADGG